MDEDTETFLMGLTPDQKQSLMSVTNQIFDTLVGYLEDVDATALNKPNICFFELEGTPLSYLIVGNPNFILAAHNAGKSRIESSVYLNTLSSFSEAKAAPGDRQALVALASESAIRLLTGRNDVVEQPRDLPESPLSFEN